MLFVVVSVCIVLYSQIYFFTFFRNSLLHFLLHFFVIYYFEIYFICAIIISMVKLMGTRASCSLYFLQSVYLNWWKNRGYFKLLIHRG
jgi:hypothetical protein